MQHDPAGRIKNARYTISFACGQEHPSRAESRIIRITSQGILLLAGLRIADFGAIIAGCIIAGCGGQPFFRPG